MRLINSGAVDLTGPRTVNSISFSSKDSHDFINLKGHTLKIGPGGIISDSARDGAIINGKLTSTGNTINIINRVSSHSGKPSLFGIDGAITDNERGKVGITISRPDHWGPGHRGVALRGSQSNTFTGDLNIIGNEKLNLEKNNDVIAVSGNLNIIDGAQVRLINHEQIRNSSRVSLISQGDKAASTLEFNHIIGHNHITETIGELYVEGKGVVDFVSNPNSSSITNGSTLILTELTITDGSTLLLRNWVDGRNHFLVKKGNKHLDDALKKIDFIGYDRRTVGKRDYNNDYWEIFAEVPESSTYGALTAFSLLGFTLFQKRRATRGRTGRARLSESLTE